MAFGRANIPKLANVIALGAQITAQPDSIEATEVEGVVQSTEAALRVLLEELARQEARTVAVAQNLPASLCTLLERPETAVKDYAAKCLERLASIVQGRCVERAPAAQALPTRRPRVPCTARRSRWLTAHSGRNRARRRRLFSQGGFAIVRGLVGLLQDEADSVNLSAMSALRMLSESRDGCDLLLDAEAIVGFVGCLSEMKRQPILLGEALFSLGNLTKLAESIKQAMAAGAVDRLMALLSEGEEVSGVQMQALVLKCVWNIANLDEGKVAIIDAGGGCFARVLLVFWVGFDEIGPGLVETRWHHHLSSIGRAMLRFPEGVVV